MRLIIAGGRDYIFTDRDYAKLDELHKKHPVTFVISGKARGADTCGEEWAKRNDLNVLEFPADWCGKGKSAGHIRNIEMAMVAHALAIFPGGKGTASMFKAAKDHRLEIFDFRTDTLF